MSKRLALGNALNRSGLLRLLEIFPSKPGILIVNHHRIGYAASDRFDREVFSASPEVFDQQLTYLKKLGPIVSCDELEKVVTSGKPLRYLYIAVTFDDGYLDNYSTAFDILKSHGTSAAFFLVTSFVGSNTVPWWDEIAYLVRNTSRPKLCLQIPVPYEIAFTADREPAIHEVLRQYKRVDNHDSELFLADLRAQADCAVPTTDRRFLTWDEAREMQAAGMSFGSHTVSHRILSQLAPAEQDLELRQSKQEIELQMGREVTTLSYPVGIRSSFSPTTQEIALSVGYKMCFSFYGKVNTLENLALTDLRRLAIPLDPVMARFETITQAKLGKLPY